MKINDKMMRLFCRLIGHKLQQIHIIDKSKFYQKYCSRCGCEYEPNILKEEWFKIGNVLICKNTDEKIIIKT